MTDKTQDLSSEKDVNAIKQKSKNAAEIRSDDIKWIMSNERGRRIIWEQLSKCHIFESSFHQNLSQTNFNEGERNIGLQLLNEVMEHAADKYMKMVEENRNNQKGK